MSNANRPALPLPVTVDGLGAVLDTSDHDTDNVGLTKREYFAALAMEGVLAEGMQRKSAVEVANIAVTMADALLARLDA